MVARDLGGSEQQLGHFVKGDGPVTAVAHLAAAYVVQAIPPHPLNLLHPFLLTQVMSLTAYGLAPYFGGFFPSLRLCRVQFRWPSVVT